MVSPASLGRAPLTSNARTRLVLLGTAGGPNWWLDDHRCGIASAVAVGDRYYLVEPGPVSGRSSAGPAWATGSPTSAGRSTPSGRSS